MEKRHLRVLPIGPWPADDLGGYHWKSSSRVGLYVPPLDRESWAGNNSLKLSKSNGTKLVRATLSGVTNLFN